MPMPSLLTLAAAVAAPPAGDPPDAVAALDQLRVELGRNANGAVVAARLPFGGGSLAAAGPHLRRLPDLGAVWCQADALSAEGLRHLAGCPALTDFGVNLPPGAFAPRWAALPWEGLRAVRTLRLSGDRVGDDALEAVTAIPAVADVHLDRVGVTAAGLAHLKKWGRLESVLIQGSGLTTEGLRRVGEVAGLRDLTLCGNRLDRDGFAHLGTLAGLRYLNLEGTGCTDFDVAGLRRLAGLTDLDLGYNPGVTDAALAHVRAMPKLAGLRVFGTKVTAAGVAGLRRARPRLAVGGGGADG